MIHSFILVWPLYHNQSKQLKSFPPCQDASLYLCRYLLPSSPCLRRTSERPPPSRCHLRQMLGKGRLQDQTPKFSSHEPPLRDKVPLSQRRRFLLVFRRRVTYCSLLSLSALRRRRVPPTSQLEGLDLQALYDAEERQLRKWFLVRAASAVDRCSSLRIQCE